MVCVRMALLRKVRSHGHLSVWLRISSSDTQLIMNSPSESLQHSELHWRVSAAKERRESSFKKLDGGSGDRGGSRCG